MTEGGWEYQAVMSGTPARFPSGIGMPVYSSQYVTNVHTACAHGGCQYMDAVRCLTAAQQVLDEAKRSKVMASEWCERTTADMPDGHSFNGKRGKVVVNREIHWPNGTVDDGDEVTYCLSHGQEMGIVPKDDVVNGEVVGEISNPS